MTPIEFPQQNIVFAKDQAQYLPLPAHKAAADKYDPRACVTTCWRLSWRERLTVLLTGKLWLQQLTFSNPLQPIKPNARCPL